MPYSSSFARTPSWLVFSTTQPGHATHLTWTPWRSRDAAAAARPERDVRYLKFVSPKGFSSCTGFRTAQIISFLGGASRSFSRTGAASSASSGSPGAADRRDASWRWSSWSCSRTSSSVCRNSSPDSSSSASVRPDSSIEDPGSHDIGAHPVSHRFSPRAAPRVPEAPRAPAAPPPSASKKSKNYGATRRAWRARRSRARPSDGARQRGWERCGVAAKV
mmetsp:Transcript_16342/g.48775  ORF Transcript_16342/g.48775 Transcript_16342/m.48775 type:complete len:219 (+) Transcript_16342:2410-3066(+)